MKERVNMSEYLLKAEQFAIEMRGQMDNFFYFLRTGDMEKLEEAAERAEYLGGEMHDLVSAHNIVYPPIKKEGAPTDEGN